MDPRVHGRVPFDPPSTSRGGESLHALFDRLAEHLELRAAHEEERIRREIRERGGLTVEREPEEAERVQPQRVEELDATIRDEVITMLLDGWSLSHLNEIGVSREYLSSLRAFEDSRVRKRKE